ncbi:MAG: TIGR04283 family arsenosugar biosynthesis glycosyltransferase [Burkholderiales bacterium]|nr:TIGR04283 family arsenosugar biosynthesis glycosyltransferase [Burkholderiales bacterium]
MSLSVIIPALNEAEHLVATLDSLQPLRRRGVEIIVVDGGSGDGTAELARSGSDQVLTAARGRARQMNAGAAAASGEILCFLHADSRLPEGADGLMIDGLARSRRSWGRFDVYIDGRHPLLRVIARMMNWRSRLTGIATGDQGLFVTRSLFEAAGHFPEIALMEDIAFSRQLKIYGAPLCITHRLTTSGRRWEQHGVWRTMLLMWRLRFSYWLGADPDRLALQYGRHDA